MGVIPCVMRLRLPLLQRGVLSALTREEVVVTMKRMRRDACAGDACAAKQHHQLHLHVWILTIPSPLPSVLPLPSALSPPLPSPISSVSSPLLLTPPLLSPPLLTSLTDDCQVTLLQLRWCHCMFPSSLFTSPLLSLIPSHPFSSPL